GNIWKDIGHSVNSCKDLLAQLRKYYLYQNPNLKTFALKLFSITPNSAGCERIFSSLSWFYGKRRYRLLTNKLESMVKIHHYYLTQVKKELPYVSKNYSEDEIQSWINRAYDQIIEDNSEDIDINSPLLSEPI
ncbi:1327_t:CDS:2, partial [Diversispora eburnea]